MLMKLLMLSVLQQLAVHPHVNTADLSVKEMQIKGERPDW